MLVDFTKKTLKFLDCRNEEVGTLSREIEAIFLPLQFPNNYIICNCVCKGGFYLYI